MQGNAHYQSHEENNREMDESNEDTDDKVELPDHKIGTKKRAKLAAKAEKKLQREVAERDREERKKREELLQKEKDKQTEREHVEQLRAEEAEKKVREEKEKREYEEYLKMKEAFNIEEEGYEQKENKEYEENLLQKFLAYIKENKVLVLEDLAAHFGLKTASVIERIQELKADGNLTGVIDDRGKFIYISEDELHTIATFVQQRGRISITELAENSNNLINLTPLKSCTVTIS
jgi:glucan-binding YG repeat protein